MIIDFYRLYNKIKFFLSKVSVLQPDIFFTILYDLDTN
jgi:hypothetical protein